MKKLRSLWHVCTSTPGIGVQAAGFNVILIAAMWLAFVHLVRIDREETIQAAVAKNDNLAIAFEQYTIRTIESADATIRFLTREYLRNGRKNEIANLIAKSGIENNAITGIVLADETGNAVTVANKSEHLSTLNVADREHFKTHIARDTQKVFVGRPVVGRVTGRTVVPITRRINKADGSFGGVAMALIEPARFVDMFRDNQLNSLEVSSLVKMDGVTLVRFREGEVTWGQDIAQSPVFAEYPKAPIGHLLARSQLDGVLRFYSYRKLADYQIVVNIGTAESDVLADFLRRRNLYFGAAALASVSVLVFTIFLLVALLDRLRAETAQKEAQAKFQTIFEQAGTGIALVDKDDGRILRGNRALAEMLGYSVDELLMLAIKDLSEGEEYQRDRDRWQEMIDGTSSSFRMEKRYRRKDGSAMWGMLISTMVRNEDGTPSFIIGMVEDITKIKESEEQSRLRSAELRELSRRLMAVSEQERRKLGRELHDRTASNLTALLLSIDLLQAKLPAHVAEELGPQFDSCKCLLRETAAQVRNVLADLRPPALDELGLLAALKQFVRTMQYHTEMEVMVDGSEPDPRAPPEVEIALFRIAQEALNNAVQHSQARHITVSLHPLGDRLSLTVEDFGRGFDAKSGKQGSGGLGMITMRERADAIGATVRIESSPGAGTRITIDWRKADRLEDST